MTPCGDCGHDYFVAFSCKGRGVCPSCNTRCMVETRAHLTNLVFQRLPVRQWVLSVPKRLRYFMQRNKVKFVWIPVSLMNPKSTLQCAALLSAANPSADSQAAIQSNTQLFNSLGATSVPYMVAKNARTGAVVRNSGVLSTPALAAFLGVD